MIDDRVNGSSPHIEPSRGGFFQGSEPGSCLGDVNKYFPVQAQVASEHKRPITYIEQLLEKCKYPERYLSPEECQNSRKIVSLRANACELFAKNNLDAYALEAANCVIEKHSSSEKEQICDKLRPLFFKNPISLEIAQLMTDGMSESSYFSLVQCCVAIRDENWKSVSEVLPDIRASWKKGMISELLKAEQYALVEEIAKDFIDSEKQELCDKLITINTLEALQSAKKIADYSYLPLVQCWIDLKNERLDFVKNEMAFLPSGPQKSSLERGLAQAEELLTPQMATDLSVPKPTKSSSHIFFVAVFLCVFACIAPYVQRMYKF
jgi:hypothetical protein